MSDVKGRPCQPGREVVSPVKFYDVELVHYEYRTLGGIRFDCIGHTLEECHKKRDKWLEECGLPTFVPLVERDAVGDI
jgi:hypothetical protein